MLFKGNVMFPASTVATSCANDRSHQLQRVFPVCPPLTLTRLLLALSTLSLCVLLSPPPFPVPPLPCLGPKMSKLHSSILPHLPLTFFLTLHPCFLLLYFSSFQPYHLFFSFPPSCPPPLTLPSLFLPTIPSTTHSFPLLPLPFGDSVAAAAAAAVGMWACLTDFSMRGLSNFYSDSKKRFRTSYQSKSGLTKGWGTLCLCAGGEVGLGQCCGGTYLNNMEMAKKV